MYVDWIYCAKEKKILLVCKQYRALFVQFPSTNVQ